MMFTPASVPDDHTLTTNALKGAYEIEAAMANLTVSSTAQTFAKSIGSAGETEKHLRKAIDDVAAKLEAHEQALASRRQPDDGAYTSDEESMPDDDDNSDDDEMSNEKTTDTQEMSDQHEKTGQSKARAPIRLKLFRKTPQTDDTGMDAITKSMNEHTLSLDALSAEDISGTRSKPDGSESDSQDVAATCDVECSVIDESSRGRPLLRQFTEPQRGMTYTSHQSDSVAGPKEQGNNRYEHNERDKDGLTWRGRGKKAMRSEPDDRRSLGSFHGTSGGQQARNPPNQEPPLDPNGRDDASDSDFDDSNVPNFDDSHDDSGDEMHDDMHDDMRDRQTYLAGVVGGKANELSGHARARRRSFEVEAEDYDEWEGLVDAHEGGYYGGNEDYEGDEEGEDADGEEEEDEEYEVDAEEDEDEESEEAKHENKYGWSHSQSDRIRFPPPPQPFFNTPPQPGSSRLEEPARTNATESTETNVSEEQINKCLAEELRRTKLDETQPDAHQ